MRTSKGEIESFAMSDEQSGQLTLDGTIEISSDITTNTIWTAGNTYHVVADIDVQALLVIEPGTVVEFASDTWMAVNNGGTLISAGTPDNPIVYTSDSATPDYGDYFCPILIEETASASTKITYNYIEYAEFGIWVMNNRLDSPIENNYLYSNLFGILEYGIEHTDVKNNLVYASYYNGIEINMESYEGQADADSHVLVQNNTCDYYQNVGIAVFGVDNEADAGEVELTNNIVSESYQYGVVLANGWMYFTIANTGYYGNEADRFGYEGSEEYNPAYETEMPYVEGAGFMPFFYLRQDCNFINAGYELIEGTALIGKTTDVNNFPDSNYTDLGFHYPNWHFSNASDGNNLTMDLNTDLIVNFKDFAILAAGWQTTYDIDDLNVVADEWLKIASAHPPITVTISGDMNNLTGDVNIGVIGYGVTTEHVFVLIDGEYKDELDYFDSNTPLLFESDNYRNGGHSVKPVAIDMNGLVTVSDTLETDFNNTFFNIIASDYFHPTADYKILGFHNGADSFEAKVTDYDDQTIWSNNYSGQSVDIVVPGVAFGNEQLCGLSITATGSGVTKRDITKKFRPEDCPAGVRMVIVLPNKDVFKRRRLAILECARACDQRNVSWVSLYYHNVNEGNLQFLYNLSSVKYIYWAGHANWELQGVERTFTECWRYEPSWRHFNWQKIGVFSWTGGLPDDWDTRGFSLWSLPMHDQWNKKIVFVDGCFSAKKSDMAEAYGVFSLQGYGSLDQIYIGWTKETVIPPPGTIADWVLFSTEGVRLFWERMGYGDSVDAALHYIYINSGSGINQTLWGLNGIPDLGDVDGDDNIFVWGLGFINLNEIELEP